MAANKQDIDLSSTLFKTKYRHIHIPVSKPNKQKNKQNKTKKKKEPKKQQQTNKKTNRQNSHQDKNWEKRNIWYLHCDKMYTITFIITMQISNLIHVAILDIFLILFTFIPEQNSFLLSGIIDLTIYKPQKEWLNNMRIQTKF